MHRALFSLLLALSLTASLIAAEVLPLFTSQDHLTERLVKEIGQEKKQISVAIYSFSHKKIAKALKEAKQRGVNVEVIVDPFTLKGQKRMLLDLAKAGVAVYVWQTPHKVTRASSGKEEGRGILHHKFCLLGDRKVWTGSFNFTYSADHYHAENALLITDAEVSRSYIGEFARIRAQSERLQ